MFSSLFKSKKQKDLEAAETTAKIEKEQQDANDRAAIAAAQQRMKLSLISADLAVSGIFCAFFFVGLWLLLVFAKRISFH